RRGPDPRSPHPVGDRPKKAVKPRARCTLADWAQTTYRLSQRRAARLIPVRIGTLRYQSMRTWKQVGEVAFAYTGAHTIADAVEAGAGRVETLELGHRYGPLSPLIRSLGTAGRHIYEDCGSRT